jgi:hypothetical protein
MPMQQSCPRLCNHHDICHPQCPTWIATPQRPTPIPTTSITRRSIHHQHQPGLAHLARVPLPPPTIANIACTPSVPTPNRIRHFLSSVSPLSAQSRIKHHCSDHLWRALHHKVYSNATEHFHLLPSILSPQTGYPLIALCCSITENRLDN